MTGVEDDRPALTETWPDGDLLLHEEGEATAWLMAGNPVDVHH
ncbi:hypothetical protein [Halomarina oriensis]|nr:hypothetical protein [Halomarina oriensis]